MGRDALTLALLDAFTLGQRYEEKPGYWSQDKIMEEMRQIKERYFM